MAGKDRGRSMRSPLRPPTFQSHQRRQAPSLHRVAAGRDWCARRMVSRCRPPHPPCARGAAAAGGIQGSRGVADSFRQCREAGRAAETCGSPLLKARNPRGSKRCGRFGPVELPQVRMTFPHVRPFSTYVGFSAERPLSSSLLLLFEREREEEEEGRQEERPSTSLFFCICMCPRVGVLIHGLSVARFLGKTVCRQRLTDQGRGNPRSTAGNACVAPFGDDFRGVYGE